MAYSAIPQGNRGVLRSPPSTFNLARRLFEAGTTTWHSYPPSTRWRRSGIAVLHENPYVHVSLIDFFDGSAFDIFATSRKAVTIVPQVGASPFSLNRLCNHIFENFREGADRASPRKRSAPSRKFWRSDEWPNHRRSQSASISSLMTSSSTIRLSTWSLAGNSSIPRSLPSGIKSSTLIVSPG